MLTTRPIVTAHDVIAACITSLTQHIVLIARIYFAFPMGLLTFNDLELQCLGVGVLRNPRGRSRSDENAGRMPVECR